VHSFREQLTEEMGCPWTELTLIDEDGRELRDDDQVLRSMRLSVILEKCPTLVESSDEEPLPPVDEEPYESNDESSDESSDGEQMRAVMKSWYIHTPKQ